MHTTDERLMDNSSKGILSAFEILISRWDNRMFNYFLRCVGDRDEAEDLRQELFFRVYQKRKTFRPDGCFQSWLYRIATNLVIDRVSQKKRTAMQSIEEYEDGCLSLSEQSNSIEKASLNELKRRIEQALHLVSADKRIVLVLHHFENMTCKEIAAMLKLPLHTVKNRLYRGLDELRIELKRLGILETACLQEL